MRKLSNNGNISCRPQAAKMSYLRRRANIKRTDKIRNTEIKNKLEGKPLKETIKKNRTV